MFCLSHIYSNCCLLQAKDDALLLFYPSAGDIFKDTVDLLKSDEGLMLQWHTLKEDEEKIEFVKDHKFTVTFLSQPACHNVGQGSHLAVHVSNGQHAVQGVCISVRNTIMEKLQSKSKSLKKMFKCICSYTRSVHFMNIQDFSSPETVECEKTKKYQELKESHRLWFVS